MIGRRDFVAGVALAAVGLPTPVMANRPARPTWVRLRGEPEAYAIFVNDVEVDLAGLDAAVLAQAMTAHPGMSEEAIRSDVRIYISAEAHLPYRAVLEVMRHLRFEKVGIVAEDRRR